MSLIIAVDLGGTKTLVRACRPGQEEHAVDPHQSRYASAEHDSLLALLEAFFIEHDLRIQDTASLCIAVAGPVSHDGQSANVTNLPWSINRRKLAGKLGLPESRIHLVNDFAAVAYALPDINHHHLVCLQAGKPCQATRLVIGAGTGLGIAMRAIDGLVMSSEGGHSDFAPADEQQTELLEYLQEKGRRVTWEQVLSGPGLVNIYRFLRDQKFSTEQQLLHSAMQQPNADIPALITENVANDALCHETVRLFTRLYGSAAANMTLMTYSIGGVYISGGIVPRIIHFFSKDEFLSGFLKTGKMHALLANIPVHILNHPQPGLEGAMAYAFKSIKNK